MTERARPVFRHEYGRLVATLSRRVGVQHLEAVEDAVQDALMEAVERWPRSGLPDHPSAWLYRVAYNRLISELRTVSSRREILTRAAVPALPSSVPEAVLASELQDDLLRMLFVSCDEAIPPASQLVFALKTLCGFGVGEIADRLFTSEANVYKRLGRARTRLREQSLSLDSLDTMKARLPAVQHVLYLLFTEGYLSSHAEAAIRRELCEEALRLALVLAAHPVGRTPETSALVALMYLHLARLSARQDGTGGLLLLEEQDRARWDAEAIERGLSWLAASAAGEVFSRYHAEARIAAAHCLAPSFDQTPWEEVATTYALLERVSPSPLHTLNRAVAVAEWQGPEAGLALIEGMQPPSWLAGSYLWSAVLADLHGRAGHAEEAARYRRVALASAPTEAIRAGLSRRLAG